MTKCFKVVGYGATGFNTPGQPLQSNGVQYPGWIRANTVTTTVATIPGGYYAGCLAVVSVVDGIQQTNYSAAIDVSEDPTNPNCPVDPHPDIAHDCINGACLPKTTYGTPGIYRSLSECEVVCGTGCSGHCISNVDWAEIEDLSKQLKNRNCG